MLARICLHFSLSDNLLRYVLAHTLTNTHTHRHTHSQTHTLGLILPFLKLLEAELHMCRERAGGIERQRETWLGEPQGWGLMTNKLSMCTNTSALQMKYRFSTGLKADEYWLKGCVCERACACMHLSALNLFLQIVFNEWRDQGEACKRLDTTSLRLKTLSSGKLGVK